jgi:ribonuclease BN (tRNA processing enzyme)
MPPGSSGLARESAFPDHTLDVLHFLFASKYTPAFDRTKVIRIVGPKGFSKFLDHLRDGLHAWTDGGEAGIEIVEMKDRDTLRIASLTVEAVVLDHMVTDVGYRFSSREGRIAAFTGDTGWCDALIDLTRDVDVLVAECSGDAAHPAPGHLTAPEVGRLAAQAGVKQVVLTHLYPLPDDRVRVAEVAEAFDGPVLLGADGVRFVV